MLRELKRHWHDFRALPPGRRFELNYRKHREEASSKPRWHAWLAPLAGIVCLAIGVVLVFIPGPAVVFFALGAALFASRSLWLSRALDWLEIRLRKGASATKRFWRKLSLLERVPVVLAALLVVGGAGFAAVELFIRAAR